jgi:hypothetical protein
MVLSQLDRLLKELQAIKNDVTKRDRIEFRNQHRNYRSPSDSTIFNYLNGKGSSADVAYDLLAFFKQKIDERNSILK